MTEPRFAVGGIDSAGTVRPFLMKEVTTSSYGLVTDTELTLAADNISISNVKTFTGPTGTVTFAAVDSSTRILLSPSSTIVTANASTVNIPTTSTVNFPSSSTVQVSATSTIQPGGTQDVYTKARYYLGTQLFTSTVIAASGTVNSGTIDISKYEIKTVSVYVTAGNNNSTLKIDVSPTASGTINEYYVSNIASTVFTTKSFTEAFSNIRVQVISSTVNSTADAWLGLMA